MLKNIILLYLFTLFFSFAYSQKRHQYTFRDVEIPSQQVRTIYKDHEGFIWMGASDGLIKLYGKANKMYNHIPGDMHSLSNNNISDITEDKDGNLWIATANGLNLFDRKSCTFKAFFKDSTKGSLSGSVIKKLYLDSKGILWVGTRNGFNKMEKDAKGNISFKHFYFLEDSEKKREHQFSTETVYESENGDLYIGTWWDGLCVLNRDDYSFESYKLDLPNPDANDNVINCIEEFEPGILIISNYNGELFFFDIKTKEFIQKPEFNSFIEKKNITNLLIYSIFKDDKGNLWLGTSGGLFIIDLKKLRLLYSTNIYRHDTKDTKEFLDQARIIYKDNNDIIWVSFVDLGVKQYDPNAKSLRQFRISLKHNNATRDYITKIIEKNNILWISTWGDGLIKAKRNGEVIKRFRLSHHTNSKYSDIITNFCEDMLGRFWIGTNKGLFCFDPKQETIIDYYTDKATDDTGLVLSHRAITRLHEDNDGTIWIITQEGTHKLDPLKKQFVYGKTVELANQQKLMILYKDLDNNYWYGYDVGTMFYDPKADTSKMFYSDPGDPNTICNNTVRCMLQNDTKNYWFGTINGLSKYNRTQNSFAIFNKTNGLPSNMIQKINKDSHSNIWILSNNFLSIYNLKYQYFTHYGEDDGLSDKSNYIFKGENGFFYLSDEKGYYYFHPDSLHSKNLNPPIYITDLTLLGQPVAIDDPPLSGVNIQYKKHIELNHDQNYFGVTFHILNYSSPEKTKYAYKLAGLDTRWIHLGTKNEVSFQNLEYGEYTLLVKGGMEDYMKNEAARLQITIHPPFWLSNWGYAIYGVFVLMLLLLYRYITITIERRNNKFELEKIKAEKAHEVDQMKLGFFFNISHEIRTPLTLISGPLHQIIGYKNKPEIADKLEVISRNVKRMEAIINQILDIRKLEVGKFTPEIINGNLKSFMEELSKSFHSYSESLKLQFDTKIHMKEPIGWFHPDSLEKIISNLLINAFKYTPQNGKVTLECKDLEYQEAYRELSSVSQKMTLISTDKNLINQCRYLYLSVKDTGAGMDKEELKVIFERFYQPKNKNSINQTGFGIGLSLTKSLTDILFGKILIDSIPEEGTCFTIFIPVDKKAYADYQLDETSVHNSFKHKDYQPILSQHVGTYNDKKFNCKESDAGNIISGRATLLIVDDNMELLNYLESILRDDYNLVLAKNGQDALEKALQQKIDLIISDIMMPVMDGLELCKRIKTEIRTSHIPVILLTARSSDEHEIQGFEIGADDYVCKPFNADLLRLRVKNTIDIRKKIWEKITNDTKILPEGLKLTKNDDNLLHKIVAIVEDNLSNSSLNQEKICKEIGLSKTQLYRKIKSLTNQSVNEFIRNIRLKKAAAILRSEKDIHIAELAYTVGFSEPSYFIKMFREKYGITPKVYNRKKGP